MSASDAFWLSIWEWTASISFVFVIVGVVIEGVEHFKKFTRKEHPRKLHIEKIGWLILVTALALEFFAEHAAKRIVDRESARLTREAGDAIKQAAESNERSKQLEATNLVLRAEVAKLEAAVQWRAITPTQRQALIDFIKPQADRDAIRTNRVMISAHQATDPEAFRYGTHIAKILKDIGINAEMARPSLTVTTGIPKEDKPLGLEITEDRTSANPSDLFLLLANAFRNAGILSNANLFTNSSSDSTVKIRVWPKPVK